MQNFFGPVLLLLSIGLNAASAAEVLVCFSGTTNPDGSVYRISDSDPAIAVVNGDAISLYSAPADKQSLGLSRAFDESRFRKVGLTGHATLAPDSVHAKWLLKTEGDVKTQADIRINLHPMKASILVESKGPGTYTSKQEIMSCYETESRTVSTSSDPRVYTGNTVRKSATGAAGESAQKSASEKAGAAN